MAAHLAAQSALNHLETTRDPFDVVALVQAIALADETVEAHPDAGFSTLIVLACDETRVVGASVGDSMALLITPTSEDELTHGQRKNPPLGSGGCLPVVFEARGHKGDQLLVMSDGVFRFVGTEPLTRVCRQSGDGDAMKRLLALQLSPYGALNDDWSAVLVRW